MNSSILIAILFLTGMITSTEADRLKRELPGHEVPDQWYGFVKQVEEIIGRKLKRRV